VHPRFWGYDVGARRNDIKQTTQKRRDNFELEKILSSGTCKTKKEDNKITQTTTSHEDISACYHHIIEHTSRKRNFLYRVGKDLSGEAKSHAA
jgi:hypothetical protein